MEKEDRKGRRINYSRKELAEYLHCAETSVDYRLKKYLIARIFKAEKIKNWDGKYNWQASTLTPCFEMRSIWETPFYRKAIQPTSFPRDEL